MQKPYAHQSEGIELLLTNERYALFWDCGTGKTLPTIRAMDERFGEQYQCGLAIIVAPKVALHNWKAEIEANAENYSDIFVLDGTPDERDLDLLTAGGRELPILILNYALLTRHLDNLLEMISERPTMLVLDESHYVKNQAAKRTKAAIKIADMCRYVVLLTGTPIGRDIGDIWSQYRAMDGGKTFGNSWYRFRNTFMQRMSHVPGLWVPKGGSSDSIKSLMWRGADHRSKEECLDLPQRTEQRWIVEPPKPMRALYDRLARDFIAQYQAEGGLSRVRAANAAAAIVKLQQVTSGFIKDTEGRIVELEWQPKLDTVQEIAAEVCPSEKVVVWARFIRDIASLLEALEEHNPLSIEAEHSAERRVQIMNLFNEDNEHRVLVSNPACGGVAINLHGASVAVYYSNDYNYIHRVQSEDRIHRIGQDKPVRYIDLVMPGTIDEAVLANLSRKGSMVDYIQGVGLEGVVLPKGDDVSEHNGDLAEVRGSGRVGRVTRLFGPESSGAEGTSDAGGAGERVSSEAGQEEGAEEAGRRSEEGDQGAGGADSIPTRAAWW